MFWALEKENEIIDILKPIRKVLPLPCQMISRTKNATTNFAWRFLFSSGLTTVENHSYNET